MEKGNKLKKVIRYLSLLLVITLGLVSIIGTGGGSSGGGGGGPSPGAEWSVLSPGVFHTVALKTDGTLWAWGDNGFGQLGDGTTGTHSPVQI